MCKKIHRGGNAEQYHADKKYKEAVAVAVEACAADTKGQTCYICTQAVHWKTKEVRSLLAECILADYEDGSSSDEDLRQAEAMHRETLQIAQRYLGAEHPLTHQFSHELGRMLAFLEVVKAGSILTNWIRRRRQQRRA